MCILCSDHGMRCISRLMLFCSGIWHGVQARRGWKQSVRPTSILKLCLGGGQGAEGNDCFVVMIPMDTGKQAGRRIQSRCCIHILILIINIIIIVILMTITLVVFSPTWPMQPLHVRGTSSARCYKRKRSDAGSTPSTPCLCPAPRAIAAVTQRHLPAAPTPTPSVAPDLSSIDCCHEGTATQPSLPSLPAPTAVDQQYTANPPLTSTPHPSPGATRPSHEPPCHRHRHTQANNGAALLAPDSSSARKRRRSGDGALLRNSLTSLVLPCVCVWACVPPLQVLYHYYRPG